MVSFALHFLKRESRHRARLQAKRNDEKMPLSGKAEKFPIPTAINRWHCSKKNRKKRNSMRTERIEDFLKGFHRQMMKIGRIARIVCCIGVSLGLAVMITAH